MKPDNYEISLSEEDITVEIFNGTFRDIKSTDNYRKSNVVTLKKKDDVDYEYDDGLNIKFGKTKPAHVTFHCMTDEVEDEDEGRIYEACDVRLYHLNETFSEIEDDDVCPDRKIYKKLTRGETPIFFRFGMQQHIKLN